MLAKGETCNRQCYNFFNDTKEERNELKIYIHNEFFVPVRKHTHLITPPGVVCVSFLFAYFVISSHIVCFCWKRKSEKCVYKQIKATIYRIDKFFESVRALNVIWMLKCMRRRRNINTKYRCYTFLFPIILAILFGAFVKCEVKNMRSKSIIRERKKVFRKYSTSLNIYLNSIQ